MKKEQKIKILQDLIQINTVGGQERATAKYISELFNHLEAAKETVVYADNRDNLVVTLDFGKDAQKVLGFTGHMDVVPVGTTAWENDPFSGAIVGNKMFGRGTSDMKSGLAAAIIAMIELKEEGILQQGKIKLLATVGEETSALGAEQLTQLGYADDLDGLIIGEPSQLNIGVAHQGALWPRITTYGHTAHGSMPQLGVNAIENMLLFIAEFKKSFDFSQFHDEMIGQASASLNVMHGGEATNEVPDQCTIEIDIRTVPRLNHQFIKEQIDKMIATLTQEVPNFKASVEYINDLHGIRTDKENPLVKQACKAVENVSNIIPRVFGGSGYTDGSRFTLSKKTFPIIILGPGVSNQAHQPNEYCDLDLYLQCIDIYKQLAITFLTDKE